ncbi:hypothetical protein MP228_003010 [Amoeboaphelidium protococcarum]|nr:hypothetical protein MP228_003010 [Amoeboaphelidium protococcarum]
MKINILSVVFIVSAASVVVAPGTYDSKMQPLLSHGELSHNTHDVQSEESSSWLSKMVASRKADVILNQARVQAEKIIAEAKEQANQAVLKASEAQSKITEQASKMLAHAQQQSAEAKQLTDQVISEAERLMNYVLAIVESAPKGGAAPLCLEWSQNKVFYKHSAEMAQLQKSGHEPFQVTDIDTYYKRCEKWG